MSTKPFPEAETVLLTAAKKFASQAKAALKAQNDQPEPSPRYAVRLSIAQLLSRVNHPPVVAYRLPIDAERIKNNYWTVSQASAIWGLPYQSTRRWLWANLEHAIILELLLPDGSKRHKLVMLSGQERTLRESGGRGNPCFADPVFQAALASRRWVRKKLAARGIDPKSVPWD